MNERRPRRKVLETRGRREPSEAERWEEGAVEAIQQWW